MLSVTAPSLPNLPANSNQEHTGEESNLGSSIRGGWRPILKQSKIHDWYCPSCGQIHAEVSGLRRCAKCGLNVAEFPESKLKEVSDKMKKDINTNMGRFGEEIAYKEPAKKAKKKMPNEYKEDEPCNRPHVDRTPLALGKPEDRGVYRSPAYARPDETRQEAINRLCWKG